LIEEVDLSGKSEAFDERRRYYRLTSTGRKLARAEAEKLADLLRVARAKKILRGEYV
jgi:DNA-binding MarR family transcriptional regulator